MRHHQDDLLTLRLAYRERIALRRSVYAGGTGPRVALVSGVHGDELEGLYLAHRLSAWLEAAERARPGVLRGTVEVYPAINPLGLDTLDREVPTHRVDLNRSFPGHPAGLLPQRLAAALVSALDGAALVVDVHASNVYLREVPQVRIERTHAESLLPHAARLNVGLVWVYSGPTALRATLSHTLNARGVPALVVEMGVGMRVTPALGDQVLTGLLHAWRALGVLAEDAALPPLSRVPVRAEDADIRYLNAETSGLFVPEVAVGAPVARDEILGHIVSPLRGEPLATVRAPDAGLLFTLREYPLVYEGSLMARVLAREAAADPAPEVSP
jgi:hypothetical protein